MKWLLVLFALQGPLPQTEKATVTGVVRLADGKPAVGIRVAAMAAPQPGTDSVNATALVSQTQTDESGRYRLEAVPPGRYYIVAGRVDAPTYYPGVMSVASATGISLGDAIGNLDFIVSERSTTSAEAPPPSPLLPRIKPSPILFIPVPSASLTGRILLDDTSRGFPLPATITLAFNRTPPVDGRVTSFRFLLKTPVRTDGGFEVTGVDVRYPSFTVEGLPAGYSVKSMSFGPTDLRAQPLEIPTGTTMSPEIVITLAVDPAQRQK